MSGVTKLFVGNIPWTVGRTELRNCFSNFGLVSRANIQFDRSTGLHRGFGFVQFAHPNSAKAAMREPVTLEGNVLEIYESIARPSASQVRRGRPE